MYSSNNKDELENGRLDFGDGPKLAGCFMSGKHVASFACVQNSGNGVRIIT